MQNENVNGRFNDLRQGPNTSTELADAMDQQFVGRVNSAAEALAYGPHVRGLRDMVLPLKVNAAVSKVQQVVKKMNEDAIRAAAVTVAATTAAGTVSAAEGPSAAAQAAMIAAPTAAAGMQERLQSVQHEPPVLPYPRQQPAALSASAMHGSLTPSRQCRAQPL